MKNENFTYRFTTPKAPQDVFDLLLDIPQWWSGVYEETIAGSSRQVGDEFTFRAGGGAHYTKQKLEELVPGKKVVWLVTESDLSFLDTPGEWAGTRITFELEPSGNSTQVTFTHEGLTPERECYGACSTGWNQYLAQLERKLQA